MGFASPAVACAEGSDAMRLASLARHPLANLPTPDAFDRACHAADITDVLAKVRASADIESHIDWLHQDCELGYERIYLHNVHRDQERFVDLFAREVLPHFAR